MSKMHIKYKNSIDTQLWKLSIKIYTWTWTSPTLFSSRFHHFHHHYHCRCCRQEWITQQQYSQKRRTELSIRRSENTEGFSSTRCRMVEVELLRGLLLPLFPFRVTFKYIITIITIAIFIKMLPKTSKVRSLANCDGVAWWMTLGVVRLIPFTLAIVALITIGAGVGGTTLLKKPGIVIARETGFAGIVNTSSCASDCCGIVSWTLHLKSLWAGPVYLRPSAPPHCQLHR